MIRRKLIGDVIFNILVFVCKDFNIVIVKIFFIRSFVDDVVLCCFVVCYVVEWSIIGIFIFLIFELMLFVWRSLIV